MSCERYANAIVDHACGAEIGPDAARHLQACKACGARFDEQRRLIQNLDDELQRLVAVEPSARFAQGVRARVEQSSSTGSRILWWSALAAAAVVLIAIGVGSMRSKAPAAGTAPVAGAVAATPDSPTVTAPLDPPTVTARDTSGPAAQEPARPFRERRRVSPPAAEVIVPAHQSRALARYLTLVRSGALDTSSLAEEKEPGAPPADLVVPPLTVAPLTVSDVEGQIGPVVDRRGPE